jgi:hypothetical protein
LDKKLVYAMNDACNNYGDMDDEQGNNPRMWCSFLLVFPEYHKIFGRRNLR